MEKELLQKCNLIAQNASIVARDEIRLFCQIMDWSDADVYFVADDTHNINLHSWLMGACELVEKGE